MYIQQYIQARLFSPQPRFDELEKFASDLRAKVENHEAYDRALGTYYGHLALHAATMQGQPLIALWRQKNPASPVATLAAINSRFILVINDFYLAIHSNWVWHEPANALAEIEMVRNELLSVKSYASADPYWYTLMASVTVALRRDKAELDQLVEEGLKRFPKNYELIVTSTAGYLSKWGGDAGKLEKHAQSVLALSASDDGVANYTRIYDVALRAQYGVLMFDLAKADWQLLMSSVRDLLKTAPTAANLNNAAVMACAGGNRALTKAALQHANFSYSDVYWYSIGTSWHPYEICRNWAGEQ